MSDGRALVAATSIETGHTLRRDTGLADRPAAIPVDLSGFAAGRSARPPQAHLYTVRGLLADLAAKTGRPIDSFAELVTSKARYQEAVPTLLEWLPRAAAAIDKEQIVRALSVPWAGQAALGTLILEFQALPAPGDPQQELARWAVGNGLEVLWDDSRFDDLASLAVDQRFGKAREMVVLGLGRSRRAEAGPVLADLLGDPVVNGHAAQAIGRLVSPPSAARAGLEGLTTDGRAWVRRGARRALTRLDGGGRQ